MSLSARLAEERRAVMATMGSLDQREGMRAFLEKRRPRFHGDANDPGDSGDSKEPDESGS